MADSKAFKTLLIFGGGFRVGLGVAKAFKHEGYRVGLVSRNADMRDAAEKEGFWYFHAQFNDTGSIESAFDRAQSLLGAPNVVVYNASASSYDPAQPMGATNEQFFADTKVNVVAPFVVLRKTVSAFQSIDDGSTPKVFIATGNVLPFHPMKEGATLGPGKAGLAHLVQLAAVASKGEDWRFYYASQVTDEDGPVAWDDVDPDAHGNVYLKLALQSEKEPWEVRFRSSGDIVT